jgi:hypothetical protein
LSILWLPVEAAVVVIMAAAAGPAVCYKARIQSQSDLRLLQLAMVASAGLETLLAQMAHLHLRFLFPLSVVVAAVLIQELRREEMADQVGAAEGLTVELAALAWSVRVTTVGKEARALTPLKALAAEVVRRQSAEMAQAQMEVSAAKASRLLSQARPFPTQEEVEAGAKIRPALSLRVEQVVAVTADALLWRPLMAQMGLVAEEEAVGVVQVLLLAGLAAPALSS